MVTKRGLEKYMGEATQIADEINEEPELVIKVLKQVEAHMENGRRQPKPPAPEGGISIRAAGRKYGIAPRTISGWAQRGYIPVMLRTRNELYVDEKKLIEVIKFYKTSPGQGKSTIRQKLNTS